MKFNRSVLTFFCGAVGVALSSLVLSSIALAGQKVSRDLITEFDGHYYVKFSYPKPYNWEKLRSFAAGTYIELPDGTILNGHLVTITSQAEQDFVSSTFLTDNFQQLWLGAYRFSMDEGPAGNWAWVTGEEIGNPLTEWGYQFMGTGEPDGDPFPIFEEGVLRMQINDGQGFPNGTGNDRWHDFPILLDFESVDPNLLGIVIEFDTLGDNFAEVYTPPVVVSGRHWRSSDVFADDWEKINFPENGWTDAWAPYPAEFDPDYFIPGTNAQHMWHDPLGTSNGMTGPSEAFFRYTFHLDVATLVLYVEGRLQIAADDFYDLYINGELVQEKHEGSPYAVSDLNITPWLRYGKNVIAIHAQDGFTWGAPQNREWERVLVDLRMEIGRTTLPSPSTAITYVINRVMEYGGASITGTVTTDGTIGPLLDIDNITEWSLTLNDAYGSQIVLFGGSDVSNSVFEFGGLTADETGLYFEFTTGNSNLWLGCDDGWYPICHDNAYWAWQLAGRNVSGDINEEIGHVSYDGSGVTVFSAQSNPDGLQLIGTAIPAN